MGTTTSKPQINQECPICYKESDEKLNNGIILKCGHYYNYFCIQKHCLKTIYYLKESNCPLCNMNISRKYINQIYKKHIF